MRLAVIGATGPSGKAVVKHCLEKGHEVLALVRNPDGITTKHDKLQVVKIDLTKEETLIPSFQKCDAVMSCLGSRPTLFATVTLYSDSIRVIVSAMRKANVNRLVCMTAAGTKAVEGEPWVVAWIIRPIFLRTILADMLRMEEYLQSECQDINYTVVKPPHLLNTPSSTDKPIVAREGQYVPIRGGMPRADVAKFMLDCLETNEWDRKFVAVAVGTIP